MDTSWPFPEEDYTEVPTASELPRGFAEMVARGQMVWFLGAGASSYAGGFPTGAELGRRLAEKFRMREDPCSSLPLIAQYVEAHKGRRSLNAALFELFSTGAAPTALHRAIAKTAGLVGTAEEPQLIITTNYDILMERALHDIGQEFSLFVYIAEGSDQGMLWANGRVLRRWDDILDEASQPVIIVKLHGSLPYGTVPSTFVVTEADYIRYLTHSSLNGFAALLIAVRPRRLHFAFIGYSLNDWHVRITVYPLLEHKSLSSGGFAIQKSPSKLTKAIWERARVDIHDVDLAFVALSIEQAVSRATVEIAADALTRNALYAQITSERNELETTCITEAAHLERALERLKCLFPHHEGSSISPTMRDLSISIERLRSRHR
jgi:hypothetical protein